jgi:myosin-1
MSTALKTPPVRGRAPPPRAAPPPQFGGKPPVPRRAPPPSRAIPPTPTRGPIPSFVPTGAPHVIKETPFANTNYMNAASAGKLAVHQKHLTADVAKKGEEELDTTFRVGLAKGAVDDMVLLSDVTNPGIVRNLLERYNEDKIYTYIGPVLISVNPFKRMSDVGPEFIKKYAGISKHDAPPHAYAVADHMYRRLIEDQYSQCVIISGESGAGKTEASKLIMNHIAACSGGGQEVSRIKSVILESNPLLEAFGNAKTIRNNNSSRFGKLLEIQFDRAGRPCGGIITNFLLEKSRVVGQLKNERNFHIFYQILCGLSPDDKTNLGLTTPEDFFVLNKTGCYTVEGVDDAAECADTLNAMNVVGLTSAEQQSIFLLLAAILHLGNVQFHEVQNNASAVSNQDYLDYAAMILGIDNAQLTTKLLSRTVKSGGGHRGSVYEVPLSAIKAAAARDALMKGIYSRIFDYIVEAVNKAMTNVSSRQSICILDIYGFEIFEKNGFEQFCINYVNEKLQQIFIELTIQSEQEDYEREGIQWTKINFFNNKTVCDLIESRKAPVGILSILDDVCKTMHNEGEGVDLKFLQKLNSISHAHFSPGTNTFRIKHYAGDVNYHCEGFVEKNKDVLFKDLVRIIQNSKVPFLAMLFENEDVSEDSRKAPTTAGFHY